MLKFNTQVFKSGPLRLFSQGKSGWVSEKKILRHQQNKGTILRAHSGFIPFNLFACLKIIAGITGIDIHPKTLRRFTEMTENKNPAL